MASHRSVKELPSNFFDENVVDALDKTVVDHLFAMCQQGKLGVVYSKETLETLGKISTKNAMKSLCEFEAETLESKKSYENGWVRLNAIAGTFPSIRSSVSDKPTLLTPTKPFNHPVYKKLALINGEINRMSKAELQRQLSEFKLDTRGVKEVLKKRLKNHYKRLKLRSINMGLVNSSAQSTYDYYLVIDFEATCDAHRAKYNHEIIEFPIVLVDSKNKSVVDEYHEYVRPVENPTLTPFCIELTGITQAMVNAASTFPDVLSRVTDWMSKHELGTKHTFAVVTDGPWDMGRFMYNQCCLLSIPFPAWARKWCNIRKAYGNFYRCRKVKLSDMLDSLGMTFKGSQHSGIDDSRNIARILLRLMQDGAVLRVNERVYDSKLKRLAGKRSEEDDYESNQADTATNARSIEDGDEDEALFEPITSESENEACDEDSDKFVTDSLSKLTLDNDGNENNTDANDNARTKSNSIATGDNEDSLDDLLVYYKLQKTKGYN